MLKPLLLTLLDIGLSCFIITPLVVTFWATVWEFIFRYPDWFPLWWTLGVSWALQIAVTLLRDILYEIHVKIRGWHFKIVSRLYIYLYCLVGLTGWRALWFLMEKYFDLRHTAVGLAVCLVPFVVISGSVNNLLALPYSVGVDHDRTSLYKYNTVFNVESTQNLGWYLLDCVFSVCVVGTLVVSVWRGHWSLLRSTSTRVNRPNLPSRR
uniref:Light-independent protochlorophyllide reductase subunit N n=1 Tax=Lygus hesperus TaxID=30085 RepID=A0A0A9WKM9_LYGHE